MINDPYLPASCYLVCLGMMGLVAACATRFVDHDFWRMSFLFCLVAVAAATCFCPSWCGRQFCGCAAILAAMILVAVCDFRRTSEQPGRIPVC